MSEGPKKVSNNDLRNSQFGGGFIDAETVNADRIGGDIYNVVLNQQPTLTPQECRNRQALLTKVKNFWVKGVLEKSLYNQMLIELGLEERPDAVANPWNVVLETGDDSPQPLPEGTKVIDIFDQIGEGRTLLILGEPGSGKTTTLLELTRDLIARAEQNVNLLIPVVFNLSSRVNKRQKIEDWLVKELNSKYDVPKKIGQAWVTQQQLLPLLDGLDEVKAEYREDCIVALNQFKQDYGAELVVCSRIKDYEALSNRLNFQSAVYIRSLTLEQACHYLDSVGIDLTGLRALIEEDTVLQELAQSPLMLYIMTLAYQGVAVEVLPKTEVLEERRRQLFGDYIEKMFKRRGVSQRYEKVQVKRWLIWLAKRMVQESQTVFFIEGMQPTWLHNKDNRILYRLGNFLFSGLVYGLIFQLRNGLIAGLFCGLSWELITVLITVGDADIKTVETLKWSWTQAIIGLIFFGLSAGLGTGLILGLILGLSAGLSVGLSVGLSAGLFAGLHFGLVFGLIIGMIDPAIATKTIPNQGIYRTARNAGIIGLILWLISVLIYGLIGGLMFGLTFGLTFGGGKACIQHFTLRLILYCNNYIPWNYARFLDYAAERIFLQKVGGGYIFIHRLLMEHFAQMELER
jgi:energy-coupling factor transporter ATP-binding protein EcfA2